MLTLTLKAASNPDYPGRYLPKPAKVQVPTFEAARTAFEMWRDENDLGGGNLAKNCGQLHADKVLLGRFSYNAKFHVSTDLKVEALPVYGLPSPALALA